MLARIWFLLELLRVHLCSLRRELLKAVEAWLRNYRHFWTWVSDDLGQPGRPDSHPALAAFFLQPWWMPRPWYRKLFYAGGKPNRLTRRINSAWARLFSTGTLPPFLVTLETRGRLTGCTHRIPLVAADFWGQALYRIDVGGER